MNEITYVLLLALLPALGNFAGGLAVELLPPSKALLNRALHAAAGVMLAVVAIAVMPEVLKHTSPWRIALMFMAGGLSYLLIDAVIAFWQKERAEARAWMAYAAVAVDLVGDGLLIGTGAALSGSLALALALGQVLADLPEGYAVVANFRDKGKTRSQRIIISASFVLPVLLAALGGYLFLREQTSAFKACSLVFIAGLYILAAVEDMIGEAHEAAEDSRWSAVSFLAGFSLFILVDGYLGS